MAVVYFKSEEDGDGTYVPTIETRTMSPIGTNTVTLSDFHESVPRTRSADYLRSGGVTLGRRDDAELLEKAKLVLV